MTLRIIRISIYQTLILYIKKENWQKRGWHSNICKESYKIENNKRPFSVSDGDSECVTVEIKNKNSKNLIITCCYRPPGGAIKGLNSFLEMFLKRLIQKINFVLLPEISIYTV